MVQLFIASVIFCTVSATVWWLWHWLVIITEGIYFGPRIVVWLYDREAFRYDDIKLYEMEDELILVVEPVLGELDGRENPILLDVATGTGRVPQFLYQDGRFRDQLNGKVIGVDASRKMLDLGIKNLAPIKNNCDWLQGSASELMFDQDVFDCVTCLESLEFFPDPLQALDEMIRVLKPDGSMLVTRRAGWEAKWFLGRYYSQTDFADLLRKKGLTDVVLYQWQNNYDLAIGRKPKIDETV